MVIVMLCRKNEEPGNQGGCTSDHHTHSARFENRLIFEPALRSLDSRCRAIVETVQRRIDCMSPAGAAR